MVNKLATKHVHDILGVDIDDIKQEPKIIALVKAIKAYNIDIDKLSEGDINRFLAYLLIVTR